jgi:MarR family 2-MHQ and catechol resistance regulon transcriptional repressor
MTEKEQIEKLAKATNILPRMMNYFSSSFKPQVEVPLKKNEIKALIELHFNPGKPMKHYINCLDMESGSFTYLADKLEEKNLIKRVSAEDDKRKTVLQLTDEGTELTNQMIGMFNSHVTDLISKLDNSRLKELEGAIDTLESIYNELNKK